MFEIILQLHGGSAGGSGSSTQKWVPNEWQKEILNQMVPQYGNYLNTSQTLLGNANNMYTGLATKAIDYEGLLNNANQTVGTATNGLQQTANGNVDGYIQNQTNAMNTVLQNTLGSGLTDLAKKGVINSSQLGNLTNTISNQAASNAAQSYNSAVSNATNSYNSLLNASTANIQNASTAQNAQQVAASNNLTDSLSAYNAGSSILQTGSGSSGTTSSNGGWLSAVTGIGMGLLACFTKGTKITTPHGDKNIEDIEVGDRVAAYSEGKMVFQNVVEVSEPIENDVIEVVTEDAEGNRHFVETTASQPILNAKGQYVLVKDLVINTELMNVGKVKAIISTGRELVYDIRTDGNNSYLANEFVVFGRF